MEKIRNYNIFIFISTFIRNIIDVYSVVYLYQKGFSILNIIYIYTLIYFLGYFISCYSIYIGNKIGYKYILIISSIITSISFYIINNSSNLYIISLSLSLSIFTYHPIRHYYGIKLLKKKKDIGNNLVFIYISKLLSSYIVIKNIKIIYLIIISFVSIIPILFIKKEEKIRKIEKCRIDNYKISFFVFDQFRILFILLEPLYLYLISNTISYVGIFNIILTVSSVICIYILVRKINISKNYKYINMIFTFVLLLKLMLRNKNILLVIAFLEGIGLKTNELVSTINLYDNSKLDIGYIIVSERVFCLVRVIILASMYFLRLDLEIMLYIFLVGIFILSFQYKKNTT